MSAHVLGIDIGGTGIKGAPVDVANGALAAERFRLVTPQPATPDAVARTVAEVARHFSWRGPIGCTFPAIVKSGRTLSATNVDPSWIDFEAGPFLAHAAGCPVTLLNDADAAGLAEMRFGAGRGEQGVVIMLTFGTGIGGALFHRGVLFPNIELGHMEVDGRDAEERASEKARTDHDLSWEKWARRVNRFLSMLEIVFSPDLIIIGGGASNKADRFMGVLETRARLATAELLNRAGIIGAALAASDAHIGSHAEPGR